MGKRKKTHYAVARGRQTGVFSTWDECNAQVKQFSGALFEGFYSSAEAEAYLIRHGVGVSTAALDVGAPSDASPVHMQVEAVMPVAHEASGAAAAPSPGPQVAPSVARVSVDDWLASNRVRFVRTSADAADPPPACYPPRVASGAPLGDENAGFNLAVKIGCRPSHGLGKRADGITEPLGIDAQARRGIDRTCLGGERLDASALDAKQAHALTLALDGESFFMTGGAGSGKSYTTRVIIRALRAKYADEHPDDEDTVAVCASTGIAAVPNNGTTLHAFAGVGLGNEPLQRLIARVRGNKRAKKRWKRCRSLLVDEVSMLDADYLDKLDGVAKAIRGSTEPLGGIQLILVGDFFQLPAVGNLARFCFLAACWRRVVPHSVVLGTVYRQQDDGFIAILNEMRRGAVSAATTQRLRNEVHSKRTLTNDNGEVLRDVLKLFPTNKKADDENDARLAELQGPVHSYSARDNRYAADNELAAKWLEKLPVPATLDLKLGSPVLLLKNLDPPRLVNGSRGRVIGFDAPTERPDASVPASAEAAPARLYPLVQFDSGVRLLVTEEEWTLEEGGAVVAGRTAVPLKCAWALSIHKAQGMTLAAAALDLAGCWEHGQAYTALSRMKSLERTRLLSFNPAKVIADPDVVAFYRELEASSL